MQAATFWKTVTMDRVDLLDRVLETLAESGVRYCVIGGQAVNAYAEPVVSLDLDLAVEGDDPEKVAELFSPPVLVRHLFGIVSLDRAPTCGSSSKPILATGALRNAPSLATSLGIVSR